MPVDLVHLLHLVATFAMAILVDADSIDPESAVFVRVAHVMENRPKVVPN